MIRVVLGDLATIEVDAVMRPVRSDLAPVSALSRDLGVEAGEAMEERLSRLGYLPIGGATLTPAGGLGCEFLIHVVVMSEDEASTDVWVRRALQNGLRRAIDMGVESLALPPLGLGAGLTEPEVAAQALVELLYGHLDQGQPPLDVTIVVTSPFEEQLFTRFVEAGALERGS